MFELKIPRDELEDLVKKMSLPSGKDEFVFDTISPTLTPEGYLEWIGRTKNITAWVRAKGLEVSGISEPVNVTLKAAEVLNTLNFFPKGDTITLIHDTDSGEDIFVSNSEKRKRTIKLPSVIASEAKEKQDKYPGKLDENGIPIYKGDRKPNLLSVCDASVFQDLVANTNLILGGRKKEDNPNIYHIIFDETNGMLRTIAGDSADRAHKTVDDEVYALAITGNGTVHYALGFPDVMSVLNGEVELHALIGGPLWVVQEGDNTKLRYLIPPAKVDRD
jgi:hypothetical protein